MIDRAATSDPEILRLLRDHPRIARAETSSEAGLQFEIGAWQRQVKVGDPMEPQHGLIELMDNNPIVCADALSVPSPASTLALIALGPITQAGLVVEAPTMVVNFEADEDDVAAFLRTQGWDEGITLHCDPAELEGVYAATVIAAIRTPSDLDEIDELYSERYVRSFYVRNDNDSPWHIGLVKGHPHAVYRLRIAPDDPISLLTIVVMADRNGKCGAAQVVHAMNVMTGLEESLGIPG
jgi:N-acetyl-gamma-glutamylphosphate reductase